MKETHPGSTVHTREEMIEDEQARVHAVRKWFREMQRKEKKKKKKHRDDEDDDEDDVQGPKLPCSCQLHTLLRLRPS